MDPYIGQLMLTSFNFAPRNWAQCNGQIMSISTNQALFSLLGTFYGGNGVSTFGLPNLQGKTPVGISNIYPIGTSSGTETHTLTSTEVPAHTHQLLAATGGGNTTSPSGALLAGGGPTIFAAPAGANMSAGTIQPYGGSQPHENRQPYLVMNWCICLNGIYPSQN